MAKSVMTYWNPLAPENKGRWAPIRGLEGMAEELTLSIDPDTGEYTRLTRFLPGCDTTPFGGKSHTYPEEVFIVSGRLYDKANADGAPGGTDSPPNRSRNGPELSV